MKIGIIDDGLDQTHPFFDPTGFTYPAGFPKGNTAYTTPKVIVARAFAPASETWKYGTTPFDPQYSDHATHVAGIAAGDHATIASAPTGRVTVSGVAPAAYIGNYKVLTVPTADYGLDGNSPEIAAGIEQAVKDGMDVINLSLGEPEIEPSRDIVVKALDDAADAGVVPVVAAGNDYQAAGRGSVGSPATAPEAISVAASDTSDEIAPFSSGGPTPISLQMKPDVTAPGESILSSIPGGWDSWDGTSMATPHVAGAAALLKQRHPTWTVEQIKSALESTGDPVHGPNAADGGGHARARAAAASTSPAPTTRLIFTDPTGLSFGLVQRGATVTRQLATSDAGGGAAPWTVNLSAQSTPGGVTVSADAPTIVAGSSLTVTVAAAADAAEGEATGFVTLTRGTDVRRFPYWFRVEAPQLGKDPHTAIATPGLYHGNTAGKASRVSTYRYPELGLTAGVPTSLSGPEQVFRFDLTRPVANFGAVVLARGAGVSVSPRIVRAGDENRLVGYPGLPAEINPYVGVPVVYPVVAAILPTPGAYDLVFDTPTGTRPGGFTFRFWVNDTTPPAVRALQRSVRRGDALRVSVTDAGSGVDPHTLRVRIDEQAGAVRLPERRRLRVHHRRRRRFAPAHGSRLRLRGVEEQRERRAGPPEHAHAHGRPSSSASSRSFSSIVGSCARSRSTLAAKSSASFGTTRSTAFRFSRSRRRRASGPTRASNRWWTRGHSAPTTTAIASTSRAMYSQLTGPILAKGPREGVNRSGLPADRYGHARPAPHRVCPLLGDPHARAARPRPRAAADMRPLRAPVRARDARRTGLQLRVAQPLSRLRADAQPTAAPNSSPSFRSR